MPPRIESCPAMTRALLTAMNERFTLSFSILMSPASMRTGGKRTRMTVPVMRWLNRILRPVNAERAMTKRPTAMMKAARSAAVPIISGRPGYSSLRRGETRYHMSQATATSARMPPPAISMKSFFSRSFTLGPQSQASGRSNGHVPGSGL